MAAHVEGILSAHKRCDEAANLEARILTDLLHDLRTPLASLMGAAELLESSRVGNLPTDARRLLKVIEGAVEQISGIVESATERRASCGAGIRR